MLHILPTQLIPEILKFLPSSKCLQLELVSKDLKMTPYLVRQYSHLSVEGKPVLVEDLLYAGPDEDFPSPILCSRNSL